MFLDTRTSSLQAPRAAITIWIDDKLKHKALVAILERGWGTGRIRDEISEIIIKQEKRKIENWKSKMKSLKINEIFTK